MKRKNIDKIKSLESPPKIINIFSEKRSISFGGDCKLLILSICKNFIYLMFEIKLSNYKSNNYNNKKSN